MHIKKLEICGFKSFVDRTVVHFDHDVIGIVGPNGCGKSNVVDAIRWVMGEQSAKALRGKAMGDVIFAGSETRQQAGFAEVTISFDNSDPSGAQSLPLEYRDYPELAVTRRLFHGDGSNEYFINKIPVRLRDVTDVFLGTGVGRKAYSIVEQGKIGLIVTARPEDRRVLIEEAAGITKYKARKKQAEQKMDQTRQNLTRVNDIVSEIERQIGNLKRQAAKAERYVKYREELDDLALWDASHRWLELFARAHVGLQNRATLAERADRERTEVDTRDAEIEVTRQKTHDAEQAAERAQTAAFTSDNDVREWETELDRAQDRYAVLTERLERERVEQSGLEEKATSLADERDVLIDQLDTIENEQEREEASVQTEGEKLDALRHESEASARALLQLRQQQSESAATIARSEAALLGIEQRAREMASRRLRLAEELERLAFEHGDLDGKRETMATRAAELTEQRLSVVEVRDALAVELPVLQKTREAAEQSLERNNQEWQRKRSRLNALTELAERMDGLGSGVKSLLSTKDDALGGIIADRVEVPAELTAAFAGLVGDRLQCVIVSDVERAVSLLRNLAEGRRGRATVIPRALPSPIEQVMHSPLELLGPMSSRAVHGEGVLGLLIDRLGFAFEDEPVVRALVGDAILVETPEHAQRLRTQLVDCDVVTLDGTVFHRDGRITGGAGDAFAAGMIEQKREMRELGEICEGMQADVERQRAEVAELRERLTRLREQLDQAKSRAHEAELAKVTAEQDLRRVDQQLQLVSRRRGEVADELAELDFQSESSRDKEESTRAVLLEAQEVRAALAERVGIAEEQDIAARDLLARQQSQFTERKVLLASVRERVQSVRSALDRVENQHGEVVERIEELELSRTEAATEAGRVAATMFEARGELLDSRVMQRRARSEAESARGELDDLRHSLALAEAEFRQLRGSLDAVSHELRDQDMELARLELEQQHLLEAIRERYRGLELPTIVGDFHARPQMTSDQKARSKELSQLIERMGAVNLDAMKEYEEQSKRYEYYTSQRDDLNSALRDLEQAISQMNRESERLFEHAFNGINRRFMELFPKMFRGGKAELRLTNPNDMLETGIEILAQPPGKRLGNIELMSGGEKAFTAVSLLFAIFRYKPSPFCILDEVDAPLDDANIDRYVEAVRAMTDRSQFIIITHSKQTMQAVDVLYGVTMQEPGVSKLVGVRVNEAATRSENKRANPVPMPEGDEAPLAGGPPPDLGDEELGDEVAVA
ncbi:MAG: chromosome segregation protein SMC [Deltaproteobacteria bacterium]|nr:chromosome segregation protein SMC [Deltaproteobacteria bacterium]